ncbi:MHS family MFS transporter [Rhodococcus qingshengii]|nr:MHS family MFS transporter [Rhodococcus qingshengii]
MRRAVLAGVIGNYTEQYEFAVYAAMAPVLAAVFFKTANPAVGTLSVYAGLAVGFLVRPLGGIIFGRLGDTVGRKQILSLTIILMGLLTTLIGILPSYASIGIAAPILLLLIRLGQGLAAGGEYAGAVSFIVEYGPSQQRARYTSFVSVSVFAGLLTGTGLTFALSALVGEQAMHDWAWRIPFLIALPMTVAGFYIRRAVQETPEFQRQKALEAKLAETQSEDLPATGVIETLRTQWKPILIFSGFAMTNAVLSYSWTAYIPGYLKDKQGLSLGLSTLSTSIALFAILPMLYLSGRLSDRIGRRKMLIAGTVTPLFVVPLSFTIISHGGFANAVIAQLIYLLPLFFIAVTTTCCIAEMFPTRLRYTAGSMAFNLAFCIFAGTSPFVASLLVEKTGTIMSVAWYICAISAVSLVVVLLFFRETYRKDLSADTYNDAPDALVGDVSA